MRCIHYPSNASLADLCVALKCHTTDELLHTQHEYLEVVKELQQVKGLFDKMLDSHRRSNEALRASIEALREVCNLPLA